MRDVRLMSGRFLMAKGSEWRPELGPSLPVHYWAAERAQVIALILDWMMLAVRVVLVRGNLGLLRPACVPPCLTRSIGTQGAGGEDSQLQCRTIYSVGFRKAPLRKATLRLAPPQCIRFRGFGCRSKHFEWGGCVVLNEIALIVLAQI